MERSVKKILVVDDQERIRELVRVTLDGTGDYQIIEAVNGEQAVELAGKELPDLILMDVSMPGGMDGLKATRALKGNSSTQGIYIILLTAKGQASDIEEGKAAGADSYFVKPFSPLELIRCIESIFD
jgi:two-component system, OmpR family, phosphate regulon response regulator PhoB